MIRENSLAGFVLVGGKSLRMGESKALLSYRGQTLAQHSAELLSTIADPVSLVGDPALYGQLGYQTIPDRAPDRGPLSGIEAALRSPQAEDWNLILACDMPQIQPGFVRNLASHADLAGPEVECILPVTEGKQQPLCALYRRHCGITATKALETGTRRVVDFVRMLQAKGLPVRNAAQFRNVNTRPEWEEFLNTTSA